MQEEIKDWRQKSRDIFLSKLEDYKNEKLETNHVMGFFKDFQDVAFQHGEKSVRQKDIEKIEEALAKYFYDVMPYDGSGKKPDWVKNGNSLKQDEARKKASDVLNILKARMKDYTLSPELEKEFDEKFNKMASLSMEEAEEMWEQFLAKTITEAVDRSYHKGLMDAYRIIAEHTDVFNKYPSLKNMILGDNPNPIKGE